MQVKKKRSVFAQTFTMVIVVGWVAVFMYPTAWHLDMPDRIYRRFHFWEKASLLVDDKIMPFADLLHMVAFPLHNAAPSQQIRFSAMHGLCCPHYFFASLSSISITLSVIFMIASGFNDMESMPSLTRNSANSG